MLEYANDSDENKRESQVKKELRGISANIDSLIKNMEVLERRLDPVLRKHNNEGKESDSFKEGEYAVPLALEIKVPKEKIFQCAARINRIIDRLEI